MIGWSGAEDGDDPVPQDQVFGCYAVKKVVGPTHLEMPNSQLTIDQINLFFQNYNSIGGNCGG
jgi:hypothetical protein